MLLAIPGPETLTPNWVITADNQNSGEHPHSAYHMQPTLRGGCTVGVGNSFSLSALADMVPSHGALDDLVVVAEGALEHLVQLVVLPHHDLLRALLSATHGAAVPESERLGVLLARSGL